MRGIGVVVVLAVGCEMYTPDEVVPVPPPPAKRSVVIEIDDQTVRLDGNPIATWPTLAEIEAILGPSITVGEARVWTKLGMSADLDRDAIHVFTLHAWTQHPGLERFRGSVRVRGKEAPGSVHAEPYVDLAKESGRAPDEHWIDGRRVIGEGRPCRKHHWSYSARGVRAPFYPKGHPSYDGTQRRLYLGFASPLEDVPCD
jgi:hypothetical protein